MELSARSYLTAGVAALGAGAIALTQVQPIPGQLALAPQRAVESLAVTLAGTIDPITPWVDTFKLSAANVQKMIQFYLEQPIPLIQTIAANVGTYVQALPDFQFIGQSIADNIQTFFKAPWNPGACATDPCGDPAFYQGDYISNVPITNKVPLLGKLSQRQLYALLPSVLPTEQANTLAPLLAFAATHYSGEIAGLLGVFASPLVQLTRSFSTIATDFQAGDVTGAINELINIPANVTNAMLNGAGYLDLTAVVNNIQPLPPEIKSIGLNLGGVISPPVPYAGTLDAPTAQSGGVLFDGIATEATLGLTVTSPGLPVGWYNSVIALGQFLGRQMLVTPPAPVACACRVKAQDKVAAATARAAALAAAAAPAAVEPAAPTGADAAAPAAIKAPATKRARATATRAAGRGAKAAAARPAR